MKKEKELLFKHIESLINYEQSEENDDGVCDVVVTIGDYKIEPRTYCEAEDAIWCRDLSDIFEKGVKAGILAAIEYYKTNK